MRRNYENKEIEREFENVQRFKPITDSKKQLIDQIDKKNDQIVDTIINSLPYNENKQELLPITTTIEGNVEQQILKLGNMFNDIERNFLDKLGENEDALLMNTDGNDVTTKTKIIPVYDLLKSSDDELKTQLKSK